MKILLLATAATLAIGQDPPPPAVMGDSRTSPHHDDSLLFGLLHQAGFSQMCVSEALDQCSKQRNKGHFASLMEETKGMVQEEVIPMLKTLIYLHNNPPRHCKDLLDSGDSWSGPRQVFPYPGRPRHHVEVYCEQNIDGGGWTVFQRRSNESARQSFERTWANYKEGFGDKAGEFWLGLDVLHQLTNMTQQELRVDLEDYEGGHRWAKYGLFHVGSQDTNYRLSIGRYSGDAGNAMYYDNGQEFTTHDADHDGYSYGNCAQLDRGGWWHNACTHANLNGYQHVGNFSSRNAEGIVWESWRGFRYSLRRTTMMVRPAF